MWLANAETIESIGHRQIAVTSLFEFEAMQGRTKIYRSQAGLAEYSFQPK